MNIFDFINLIRSNGYNGSDYEITLKAIFELSKNNLKNSRVIKYSELQNKSINKFPNAVEIVSLLREYTPISTILSNFEIREELLLRFSELGEIYIDGKKILFEM